jgi:hypothetical protein
MQTLKFILFLLTYYNVFGFFIFRQPRRASQEFRRQAYWEYEEESEVEQQQPVESLRGGEGEMYFDPTKPLNLVAEDGVINAETTIAPVFPHSRVIAPYGKETITVTDMNLRKIIADQDDVAVVHWSNNAQKFGLVGTLSEVIDYEYLEDGRIIAKLEGKQRFYLKRVVGQKPYLRAEIQFFEDYTENENEAEELERVIYYTAILNVKV